MADIPDIDPTKPEDQGAAGGATGDGDENPQDYNLPGGPTERRWERGGARPKNPYAYQKLPEDDKDIHMSEFPKEKSGLPNPKCTAETSFTTADGELDYAAVRTFLEKEIPDKNMARLEVEKDFPNLDRNQLDLRYHTIKRQGTTIRAIIEVKIKNKDKWYPLYTKSKGDTEKTKEMKKALEPFKEIKVKDTKIQQKAQEREELKKTIEEDRKVADDENEQPSVRQRARERVAENTERDGQLGQEQNQLEQEREQIVERLPLRERLKDLFKKHGFTLATVVTAVGITIGVIAKILADGASAAANGIKTVGKKVGDGLKELGKKIGSIVPGLVGAIASFVFRAVRLSPFLAKTLGCLSFSKKITKKRRE